MENKKISSIEKTVMEAQVVEMLRACYDPEIPVNIYELGLVYAIDVSDQGEVTVKMTLTSPSCPAIQSLPGEIEQKIQTLSGVKAAYVKVVWDPPWDPSRMTEAAKLELGMF
jgi:FeS assembly SUF system protein